MTRGGKLPPLVATAMVLALSACAKDDTELRNWLANEKSRQPPPVEPIPSIAQYKKFLYAASHLRDPFEDILRKSAAEAADGTGPQGDQAAAPETNRRPEPLESYPLDALRMVGTLEKADESGDLFALIQAPDSTVTRVMVGNYMGQNYGRIISIGEYEVQLEEKIPDGNGGWFDRATAVAIVESSN